MVCRMHTLMPLLDRWSKIAPATEHARSPQQLRTIEAEREEKAKVFFAGILSRELPDGIESCIKRKSLCLSVAVEAHLLFTRCFQDFRSRAAEFGLIVVPESTPSDDSDATILISPASRQH
jgi:hypothetical protein